MADTSAPSATELAWTYFQAPRNYFWRWAERGEAVEWQDGSTICLREDLQIVLDALAPDGLPPLGAVLLLLAACGEGWPDSGGPGILQGLSLTFGGHHRTEEELTFHASCATRFLDVVYALPRELRTGPAKLILFREVLQSASGQPAAGLVQGVLRARSRRTLEEWTSGRLDAALPILAAPATREHYVTDLRYLASALEHFPNAAKLALRLRTGLEQVPPPLPEPPAPPLPEAAPAVDLLDELSQDPRTAGLARLAQHLVAALRIPLHTRAASEQPLGGVADITNRGSFDRLLISELAHDDLTLMARLVNNEALYLRREAPPAPDVRPRTILLDTTLRMWGVPRVFALAAALAWTRHARPPHPPVSVAAYALGGHTAAPLALDSLAGVVEALTRLDVAPHAGASLRAIARTPAATATDSLLITDAQLLAQPEFAAALADTKSALRFLLTVDRDGELRFYEFQQGHRTLLSTTRYDLDALLFAPAASPRPGQPKQPSVLPFEPAYLAQQPAPLYFPVVGIRPSEKTTFYAPSIGALGITNVQRVLHCPRQDRGALELLPFIELGQYHFGFDDAATVYVLVDAAPKQLVFYAFATDTGTVERVDLTAEMQRPEPLTGISYWAGCFFLRFGHGRQGGGMHVVVFNCKLRVVMVRHGGPFPKDSKPEVAYNAVKRHINGGYNVLQRVEHVGISDQGHLLINGHKLQPVNSSYVPNQTLVLVKPTHSAHQRLKATPAGSFTLPANDRVRLHFFNWPDGSTGVADSRGLLHLRSAKPEVPEITLLLIINQQATAAWAADDAVCGPEYFTSVGGLSQRLSGPEFYRQYIQRFISALAD